MNMLKIKKMQLNQLKALNNEFKIRENRTANIALTNSWFKKQHTKNIQNEYDRIRNLLESSVVPKTIDKKVISDRMNELKTLGARMYDDIG